MKVFNHDDVLVRIAHVPITTPLYFLPCRDRIVACRVRLHVLVVGSLHPTAMAVLEALSRSSSLSIRELADATGANGVHGLRFTSELVARLCAAHQIEQLPATASRFRRMSTVDSALRPITEVVEHKLYFLPRSGRLVWNLSEDKALAKAKVRWWQPPDEKLLYSVPALSKAIQTACPEFVKDRRNLLPSSPRDFSMEELERDKLILRSPELIEAEAEEVTLCNSFAVHRCYFHADSSGTAWVKVYRADEPVRDVGYSAYFQAAVVNMPGFLKAMQAGSVIIPR